MKDRPSYTADFGPFADHIWLNSASEGPLPRVAVAALQDAIQWKIAPHQLTFARFAEVPRLLKKAAAPILGLPAHDIILANSATYGIHLLAQGLPLKTGDEILLMQNDFPVDILPWLHWEQRGVKVRQEAPAADVFTTDEIAALITPQTRVLCLSHVHTFSGRRIDPQSIGAICRQRNVIFVLNVSQSAGIEPLALEDWPVDAATTSGFKWLCGPYGTGLCWVRPQLREQLQYHQAFWSNVMSEAELQDTVGLRLAVHKNARQLDVFGTANFFNFVPFTESLKYFHGLGIRNVQAHIDELVEILITGLHTHGYRLISAAAPGERTGLVVFSHAQAQRNAPLQQSLAKAQIHLALWKGNLRASPHVFNTPADIDQLLTHLAAAV